MEVYVVFGVSGCGKSTVGKLLADKTNVPHYDADDFHPKSNVDKMRGGNPLNDEDRAPWLETLAHEIGVWSDNGGAVLSCSALKEKYRQLLSSQSNKIRWVLLNGSNELLSDRLANRKGHFFNSKLLDSQIQDLEIPTYGLQLDIINEPEVLVQNIIKHFNQ